MKVFLIDDNDLVRDSLSGLLQDLHPGLKVSSFATCEAALSVSDVAVDYVLLDFTLVSHPGSNVSQEVIAVGARRALSEWTCFAAVRRRFGAARIVLMSAHPRDILAPLALTRGAFAYVEKSVQASVLLNDLMAAFRDQPR
jgi:DNA-binding NarL/FixJ family response regulator